MEIKKMESHQQWKPECKLDFMSEMRKHAPFVFTTYQQRNDLGDCVIGTYPPHVVCKLRSFKTSDKRQELATREEDARIAYLEQRKKAIENGIEAERKGITVRTLIEGRNMVYDQEFDEPRLVTKIPGLNAYLELVGCLDEGKELDWDEVLNTVDIMAKWATNIWDNLERKRRATVFEDEQPIESWHDEYDQTVKYMLKKRGLGHNYIDPSRRPEYLHSSMPQYAHGEYEMIKQLKRAQANLAAQGVLPENYGE